MKRIRHWIRAHVFGRVCPYSDIAWRNYGMEPNRDTIHDVFKGKCRVCGAWHRAEMGQYWVERDQKPPFHPLPRFEWPKD